MSTTTPNAGAGASKEPPNRFSSTNKSARSSGRKISLPWFRQNSLNASALARQHTIDSPGSYRYVKQISENNAKVVVVVYREYLVCVLDVKNFYYAISVSNVYLKITLLGCLENCRFTIGPHDLSST